jgi:glutathione peroxidase
MIAFLTLATTPMNATSLHDFKMTTIKGEEQKLSEYKGKVVMVVNVASKCGLTKQYTALQKLYDAYKEKGFVILGFPANEFGNQEPGTNGEILEFCSRSMASASRCIRRSS